MKTLTYIAIILITIVAVFYFTAEKPTKTEVVLIFDRTDKFLSSPDGNEILSLYDLKANPNRGATFRLVQITDVDYTPTIEANMPPFTTFGGSQITRVTDRAKFQAEIKNALSSLNAKNQSKAYSSIYAPLVRELARLKESTADTKILLLYSDLMENTDFVSFYSSPTLALVKTKPDTIRDLLGKQAPIPDLTGIEIHIIYEPKDHSENSVFTSVSHLYKSMLEAKGAKVLIGANLM